MRNYCFIVLSVALGLTGCSINLPQNYRGDSWAWGGYEPDRIYILSRDVFVMRVDGGLSDEHLALVPEADWHWPSDHGRFYDSPDSVKAYRDDVAATSMRDETDGIACRSSEVDGIALLGTHLRPSRVERNRGLNWWYGTHDSLIPFAVILDGPYAGTEVDLSDVSDAYQLNDSGPFLRRPVALILEAAE